MPDSDVKRLAVPFSGAAGGEGALTWGQREIWLTMRRTGRTLNIGGTITVPPTETLQYFTGLLAYLVGRHQALRTRFVFDGAGDPVRQVVDETGTVYLDVVDGGTDADAAAEELRSRYEFTPFDLEREYLVRMGVVERDGVLSHLVVQYSHLAVDGFGIDAIVRDLAHLGEEHPPPVSGLRPVELAERQQSPAGQRQSAKAMRHWKALLADVPAARLSGSDDPRTPRFKELVFRSPALHLALQSVAARTRAETGHVLLAAYAVALARVTGLRPVVAQVLVSNRFRPDCADAVCHLTQPGLAVVDPGPPSAPVPFDELVARVWKAATAAYLHGYYAPEAHSAMLAEVTAERGGPVDLSCFVNDRRAPPEPGPVPATATDEARSAVSDTAAVEAQAAVPDSAADGVGAAVPDNAVDMARAAVLDATAVQAATGRTTARWERELPAYDGSLYLQVDSDGDAVQLGIWADTHAIAPADVERFAYELEATVVVAV